MFVGAESDLHRNLNGYHADVLMHVNKAYVLCVVCCVVALCVCVMCVCVRVCVFVFVGERRARVQQASSKKEFEQ
jgi:hypothetical protein